MSKTAMALVAFSMLGIFLSACGSSASIPDNAVAIPDNAIATVGGEPITKAEFDRALATATVTEQRTAPLIAAPVPPDPPSYAKCIAALRQGENARAAALPDSYYRSQCKEDYVRLRDQVMSQLLQAAQLERLAGSKDIAVAQQEVDAALVAQRKQAHLSERTFKARLKALGMTRQDFLSSLRVQLLSAKIAKSFGTDQAALQAAQGQLKQETVCRQGYMLAVACGNASK